MGPVFLLCEICVRAEKACVWAMTNQLQCTAEMRHSKKPPLQEEQGLRVGGEVGLTKGVAVNYLRETQTSELIGLLGFKLVGDGNQVVYFDHQGVGSSATSFYFLGMEVEGSSAKGGGYGVELRARYAILQPVELAVERFKDCSSSG